MMPSPVPFMTREDFADLLPVINDGWATLLEWTEATVTFTRQDATSDVVELISIDLADRQEQVAGTGTGTTTTELGGTLRAFTSDFDRPARQGDRFAWNGMYCTVTAGPFIERDTTVLHFVMRLGNV